TDGIHDGREHLELQLGESGRKPREKQVRRPDRSLWRSSGGHHRNAAREVRDERWSSRAKRFDGATDVIGRALMVRSKRAVERELFTISKGQRPAGVATRV